MLKIYVRNAFNTPKLLNIIAYLVLLTLNIPRIVTLAFSWAKLSNTQPIS